jgi:hypothetical protein
MFDAKNIDSIEYNIKKQEMTIFLKKAVLIKNFNRTAIKMACNFEKFKEYAKKMQISYGLK